MITTHFPSLRTTGKQNRSNTTRHRTKRISSYKPPSAPRQPSFSFVPDYNLRGLGDGIGSILWGPTLPSQLLREPLWSSQKRLCAGVLEVAISDLRHPHGRLHREALAWLLEEDESWPFSFVNVCRELGLDVGLVRKVVLKEQRKTA